MKDGPVGFADRGNILVSGNVVGGRLGGSGVPNNVQKPASSKTTSTSANRKPKKPAGSGTDFAIIEPVMGRHEI